MADKVIAMNVVVGQVNCKHQWPFPKRRIKSIFKDFESQSAMIVTANEISDEQFNAIVRGGHRGWAGHYVANDKTRGGGTSGNAVFWRISMWRAFKRYSRDIEVNYRRGKRFTPKGPWGKRTLHMACVNLENALHETLEASAQAFHYPTRFNSDEKSRLACRDDSTEFASKRMAKGRLVIMGGDGNGMMPETPPNQAQDGPDRICTNARFVSKTTLYFRRRGKTDHNGIVLKTAWRVL